MSASSAQQVVTRSITLIVSPYHVGIRGDAVGAGPLHLVERGLTSTLQALGVDVREITVEPLSDADGDIGRSFEIIRQTAKLVTEARNASSFPIVLSGNCSATIGVHAGLSGCKDFEESEVGCVWFDAHDDFNVPDTVLSGYFDSMPIAAMAGQCWRALCKTVPGYRPLTLEHLVHCGLRDLNDLELDRVKQAHFPVIWGSTSRKVDFVYELTEALKDHKHLPSAIHVDLDCLDSCVGQVNKFEPAPGGLLEDDLVDCMKVLPAKVLAASLTVASFDPQYDVAGNISRVAIRSIAAFVQSLLDNGILTRKV